MALEWPFKDPDEKLDYQLDWSARLDTDTISTSTWIVPDGLTSTDESSTDQSTTIWLAGGTTGENYVLTNRIATTGGRIMDQSVRLKVRDK